MIGEDIMRGFQEEATFKPTLNRQHSQPHSPLLTPSIEATRVKYLFSQPPLHLGLPWDNCD